jgi:putative FmdB family regulatory protein
MPIYEYECGACAARFEVKQSYHDEPKASCKKCGGAARRLFKPVPIVFKGSGFYVTDHSGNKDHLVNSNGKTNADSLSKSFDKVSDTKKSTDTTAKPEAKATESKSTAE